MVLFNRHATLDPFLEDNLDQDTTLRLSKHFEILAFPDGIHYKAWPWKFKLRLFS